MSNEEKRKMKEDVSLVLPSDEQVENLVCPGKKLRTVLRDYQVTGYQQKLIQYKKKGEFAGDITIIYGIGK